MVTMDHLLESLINKAKIESQDAHRLLLCALNGTLLLLWENFEKYLISVICFKE